MLITSYIAYSYFCTRAELSGLDGTMLPTKLKILLTVSLMKMFADPKG